MSGATLRTLNIELSCIRNAHFHKIKVSLPQTSSVIKKLSKLSPKSSFGMDFGVIFDRFWSYFWSLFGDGTRLKKKAWFFENERFVYTRARCLRSGGVPPGLHFGSFWPLPGSILDHVGSHFGAILDTFSSQDHTPHPERNIRHTIPHHTTHTTHHAPSNHVASISQQEKRMYV